MRKLFSSAALVSLAMIVSSQVLASQDYTVHFKNSSNQTKYVKQVNSQCMHSPKNGNTYTVPPQGEITIGLTDSNNVSDGCTNGAKEINWAVDGDKSFKVVNLTFRHQKISGTWYTKITYYLGLSATATCNGKACSISGKPGVSGEPSPIVITFK